MAILVILTAAYAFAPHPPAMPEQVLDATELETYLNRLVDSGNPPGLVVDRVRFGNYALRYLLYQHK